MESIPGHRGFWETYTLGNIRNEIKLRLSALRTRRRNVGNPPNHSAIYDDGHARGVGQFYDSNHDQFMRVYGEVIQAFRTKDVTDLLNYQIESIGFQPGQHVLDAGCGIAAPAIYFATHVHVHVDAITISSAQQAIARQKVAAANLSDDITVVHGDYHNLTDHFKKEAYDVVYFLESFGHSRAKARLVDVCWEILKPGGILYIKDLFRRIPLREEHKDRIDREIQKINEAYWYDVGDLNAVLDDLRRKGFILSSLKTIDLELEEFEDLAISNEFQELTGIALIGNWGQYIFPVDFFEIKCVKPEFNIEERLDRYFLQSRYHRQIEERGKGV